MNGIIFFVPNHFLLKVCKSWLTSCVKTIGVSFAENVKKTQDR